MRSFKINKIVILVISSLITSFLFFIAGNLIFVEQRASTFTTFDKIKFSKIDNNESQLYRNDASSQAINTEKIEDEKISNARKNFRESAPLRLSYSSNKKAVIRDSMLTLEGDYFPLFKLKPDYPPRALEKGREGFCLVNYTIEPNGTVRDVAAVDSDCDAWFRRASINAAKSFIYKPRVKNGVPLKVKNVRNKFVFKILEK